MTNAAIVHREFREQITFTETPSAETCKQLRAYGFEYDRKGRQWFRADRKGKTTDEQAVIGEFVE